MLYEAEPFIEILIVLTYTDLKFSIVIAQRTCLIWNLGGGGDKKMGFIAKPLQIFRLNFSGILKAIFFHAHCSF